MKFKKAKLECICWINQEGDKHINTKDGYIAYDCQVFGRKLGVYKRPESKNDWFCMELTSKALVGHVEKTRIAAYRAAVKKIHKKGKDAFEAAIAKMVEENKDVKYAPQATTIDEVVEEAVG
jgi:hypothetical protein